jgi:thiol:disulfide interchange protein DsbD
MYITALAQKPDPVHWDYALKKLDGKAYEVHIKATIDGGWHIYSQTQPKEAIAVPTKIVFTQNPLLVLTGKPKESGKKETYRDPIAGIVQYQYAGMVEFVQTLTLKAEVKMNISGTITYQACTSEMCLPPKTIPFNIPIQ